jgi:hypothetical protein
MARGVKGGSAVGQGVQDGDELCGLVAIGITRCGEGRDELLDNLHEPAGGQRGG